MSIVLLVIVIGVPTLVYVVGSARLLYWLTRTRPLRLVPTLFVTVALVGGMLSLLAFALLMWFGFKLNSPT